MIRCGGPSPVRSLLPLRWRAGGTACQALDEAREPLMLVGHLPHLSRLASALLVGDAGKEIVHFGNASLACLDRTDVGWRVEWVLTPVLAAPHD